MFDEDNIKGLHGEEIAEKYLYERQKAYHVFKVPGSYMEFDMIAIFPRGKTRTIECKTDIMEERTGNLAVEYSNRGKLSGVLLSTADWYIFILKEKLLCLKHRDLLYFLRQNPFREVKGAGDFSTLILVPTESLISATDEHGKPICDVWKYDKTEPEKEMVEYLHDV